MTQEQEHPLVLDDRTQQAVTELEGIISRHYPTATFRLSGAIDDPRSINLTATVDVDDPDEVLERVVERVIDLNVDEGIPLHVIPVRTPERIAADKQQARQGRRRFRPRRIAPLLGRLP